MEGRMKRKYREAMRDKADRMRGLLDQDDEAVEARDWHDEWVIEHDRQNELSKITENENEPF
jgi:hypothetical protein